MCVTIRNFIHGVLLLPSLKKQRELIQGPITIKERKMAKQLERTTERRNKWWNKMRMEKRGLCAIENREKVGKTRNGSMKSTITKERNDRTENERTRIHEEKTN